MLRFNLGGKKTKKPLSTEEAIAQFPEEPIPLITFGETEDQLIVNDKAVEVLNVIDGPVAVIAMAGLYRTGKSAMLNWLLGRQNGFRVGPTVERCTRGIWLWGRPQKKIMRDGEEVWVLVLDTEGMGGLEASQQYDARIFSLATLLCSKMIYNSQGSVDEKAISSLSFIANLAKHIKISAEPTASDGNTTSEDNDAMQFHNFFPSFMWIVRDFTLELVDEDGDPITSSEYLESALADAPRVPSNMERNRIRAMLKDFFRDRDCVTMVRPVLEESQLQEVDKLPITELRPEFQQQLEDVKNLIYGDSLKPKMLQNKPLNGSMFAGLLHAYVDAINSGGVPVITSAWDGVTASECRKAMNGAYEVFQNITAQLELPLDDNELQNELKEAEKVAITDYRSNAIGDMKSKLEVDLLKKLEMEKTMVIEKSNVMSQELCERLLQTLYTEMIQPRLTSDDAMEQLQDMAQFKAEWEKFRSVYEEKAKGAAKLTSLMKFSETKHAEAMRVMLSRQEEAYEKKIRSLQTDVAKVKEELGSVGGREQIYKEQLEQLQLASSQAMSERAKFEAEAQEYAERISQLESTLQSEFSSKESADLDQEAKELKFAEEAKKRAALDAELKQVRAEHAAMIKERERHAAELKALSDECEMLRVPKSQGCGCTIQ